MWMQHDFGRHNDLLSKSCFEDGGFCESPDSYDFRVALFTELCIDADVVRSVSESLVCVRVRMNFEVVATLSQGGV